ncbi:MAG TPA: hypothetical protein VJJ76_01760 [archaeon]|nr:hypothetical protein [archaeon]
MSVKLTGTGGITYELDIVDGQTAITAIGRIDGRVTSQVVGDFRSTVRGYAVKNRPLRFPLRLTLFCKIYTAQAADAAERCGITLSTMGQ